MISIGIAAVYLVICSSLGNATVMQWCGELFQLLSVLLCSFIIIQWYRELAVRYYKCDKIVNVKPRLIWNVTLVCHGKVSMWKLCMLCRKDYAKYIWPLNKQSILLQILFLYKDWCHYLCIENRLMFILGFHNYRLNPPNIDCGATPIGAAD